MRLCRFNDDRLGIVCDGRVVDVTPALQALPSQSYPFPRFDLLVASLDRLKEPIETAARLGQSFALPEVKLLAPIINPGKVVAAPVNYGKHLDEARADAEIHHQNQILEIQRVGLFLKATSAIVGAGEGVAVRHLDRRTDHEVELAVIIGKAADRISRAQALEHVAGYCIGLDITVRGPEERSLRKSIDSYCVLGPWIVTADELGDPSALGLTLSVNGETRQSANTRDLIINIPALIEFASSYYTLMPGDVILTGTPEGVGRIEPGDVMRASIDGIGAMDVAVRSASAVAA